MSERPNTQFVDYELTPRPAGIEYGTEFQSDDEVALHMSELISLDEVRARRMANAATTERVPAVERPQLGHEISAENTGKVIMLRHNKLAAEEDNLDARQVA